MRVVVLAVTVFTMFFLTHCSKPDKAVENNEDDYGEYEIADPEDAKNNKGPAVHVVEIIQMKFVPDVLKIHAGDTVVWINKDMVDHDVTETTKNLWASSRLPSGASWKKPFTDSQQYHCNLHMVMTARIIVDGKDVALITSPGITMCDSEIVSTKIASN